MSKTYFRSFILVLVFLLSACGPKPSDFYNGKLLPFVIEFQGQEKLANQTPREAMTPVISQMVATNTKIQILSIGKDVPKCAKNGLSDLILGTSAIISAAQEYSTIDNKATDAEIQAHDQMVNTQWDQGTQMMNDGIARIKTDCKLK